MLQNLCDAHTHTLYSRHAYSTVHENVMAARAMGLELLGSTDHFSDMLVSDADLTHAHIRDFQFFSNYRIWPDEWEGIRLMHGLEADIRTLDGRLFGQDVEISETLVGSPRKHTVSLYDHLLPQLDYVVASIHYRDFTYSATIGQTTEMYIGALNQPKVLILGHIGRSGVPFDIEEVVGEAARQHKLIEINEHSLESRNFEGRTWKTCQKIAETCAEMGCQVAVDTDAHMSFAVGHFESALFMLDRIHFPQELIATRTAEAFLLAKELALGE